MMRSAAYKLLGIAVWKGSKLYARRRYGHLVPSRRALLGGLLGLAAVAAAIGASRNRSGGSAG
jgi:hypothetical protein